MPGIITSSVITAGLSCLASSSPVWPSAGQLHPEAFLAQRALHQVAHRRVIIDHQHGRAASRRRRPIAAVPVGRSRPRSVGWRLDFRRQRDGEGANLCPARWCTVMSPPISWQNLRLMARPRPVPPYLRVVEASAWLKAWNSLAHLLRRHADAGVGDAKSDQWT